MRYFLGFILLISTFSLAFAQFPGGGSGSSIVGKITGTITDSISGDPVEFATIVLHRAGSEDVVDGTISDEKGDWELRNVKPGEYDINISFIGYTPKSIRNVELTPKNPDAKLGALHLVSDQVVLETVTVEGQRALVENKVDRIVYNAENDVTNRGGDAADVLRKVPMLSVDMEGNVSLRGSENIKILVNGKPSGIFSGSIADALKMIPADEIAKVEVITTPSAKYDGEGSGGIINIITSKSEIQGMSGNVNASLGTRQNRAAFNISGVKQRFGINGGGGIFAGWPQKGENFFLREDQVGDQTRILRQEGFNNTSRIGFRGKIGAFYDFNAYNAINSTISFRGFTSSQEGEMQSLFQNPLESMTEEYKRLNDGDNLNSGFDWTSDYTRKFDDKGHELVLAFQLNGNLSKDKKILERIGNDPAQDYKEKNQNTGDNIESTIQVDYTKPFTENIQLEAGAKTVFRNIDSEYDFEIFDPLQNGYVTDLERTNEFLYGQNVYAGYASMNITFAETWSAVAGARYENTQIDGKFQDGSGAFDQNYGNVLPTLILSKKINYSTIKASYTERIQRPSLFYINPYRNQEDRNIITEGNPYLSPELTSQYELGYSTFIKGMVVNLNTYYRRTKDIISSYLRINEQGVSVNTFENIGVTDVYGANVFASVSVSNNLTLRGNFDINQHKVVEASEELNVHDPYSNWITRVFLSGSYSFAKGWKAEVFGFYNSQRWSIQGRLPSFSMMNFGIQKEIFGDRGTLGLTVTDPFNKSKTFETHLQGAGFTQESRFSIPFQSFGLTFSYRFGNLDFKQQDRKSAIENTDLKSGNGGQEGQEF